MSRLNNLLHSRVTRNALWLIGGKALHMLIALFVSLLTARYLGPGNYGLINYAAAYTSFFASLCTLGINSVIVKEFVDAPDAAGETVGTALGLRIISSTLSVAIILLIALYADGDEPLTVAVVFLCSLGLVFQIFDTFHYWFQFRLESKYSAIATTAAYLVVSGYKLVLLISGKSVAWFAVATSVEYLCVAVFLLVLYRHRKGPRLRFSWKRAKSLLGKSCHYILAGLMVSIYSSTDRLMLKHMLTEEAVGYYATAVQICNLWVFLLTAVIDSMQPSIMQAYRKDYALFQRKNRQLYALIFYAGAVVSVGLCLLGDWVVVLLYGPAYAPAAAPLRVITWYVAFSYLGVARNAWMVSENKQKYLTGLYVGAAGANVVLNLLLIPRWGTVGAAVASLVTQVSTILIFPMLIKDLRSNAKLMLQAFALQGLTDKNERNEDSL